jgi:hypothetical protein
LAGWQVILRAVALPATDASTHGWSPRLGRAGGADGNAAGSRDSVPGDGSTEAEEDESDEDGAEGELSAEAASDGAAGCSLGDSMILPASDPQPLSSPAARRIPTATGIASIRRRRACLTVVPFIVRAPRSCPPGPTCFLLGRASSFPGDR